MCNACNACISPCPTGAIDNWRQVIAARAYTLEEQFSWDSLPKQVELEIESGAGVPEEVQRLIELAAEGTGGPSKAPHSAEKPRVNLFGIATISAA